MLFFFINYYKVIKSYNLMLYLKSYFLTFLNFLLLIFNIIFLYNLFKKNRRL